MKPDSSNPPRILLLGFAESVVRAVARYAQAGRGLEFAAAAADLAGALGLLKREKPDWILIDAASLAGRPEAAIRELKLAAPGVHVALVIATGNVPSAALPDGAMPKGADAVYFLETLTAGLDAIAAANSR